LVERHQQLILCSVKIAIHNGTARASLSVRDKLTQIMYTVHRFLNRVVVVVVFAIELIIITRTVIIIIIIIIIYRVFLFFNIDFPRLFHDQK